MQHKYLLLRISTRDLDSINENEGRRYTADGSSWSITLPTETRALLDFTDHRMYLCSTPAERTQLVTALKMEYPCDAFVCSDVTGVSIPVEPVHRMWNFNEDGVFLPCD